jgi:23S rRNA (uracil1939-C5)-methyltransferase
MEPDFVSSANEIIAKWAEDFNIHAFDESTGRGLIKNIIYRSGEGTGERMLVVVATDFQIPNLDELMLRLEPLKFTSVWICRNKSLGNSIWTDELKKISGKEHIYTCLAGLKYEISARSFLQLNIKQCEKLYGLVLEFADVKSSDVVFDLYCGIGTITLKLAQKARKVYGIEIVPEAVKNAVRNAELNDLRNVEFIEGKSETVCEELVNKKQIRADIVVVDPPRKGCDSSLINTLIFLNPEKIVYVSCNPKTLARDLKLLESDYKITKIATVDMFPNTLHVESVVKLTRAGLSQ